MKRINSMQFLFGVNAAILVDHLFELLITGQTWHLFMVGLAGIAMALSWDWMGEESR